MFLYLRFAFEFQGLISGPVKHLSAVPGKDLLQSIVYIQCSTYERRLLTIILHLTPYS